MDATTLLIIVIIVLLLGGGVGTAEGVGINTASPLPSSCLHGASPVCDTEVEFISSPLSQDTQPFFEGTPCPRAGTNRSLRSFLSATEHQPGENQWLETNITKQPNTTRMRQKPTAPRPNIMAKATMQRAKNIQPAPSSIPKMLANTASKPTPRANSRSDKRPDFYVGPFHI